MAADLLLVMSILFITIPTPAETSDTAKYFKELIIRFRCIGYFVLLINFAIGVLNFYKGG